MGSFIRDGLVVTIATEEAGELVTTASGLLDDVIMGEVFVVSRVAPSNWGLACGEKRLPEGEEKGEGEL